MISGEGFRNRKIFFWYVVVLNVVKIACIVITSQIRYYRRDTCTTNRFFNNKRNLNGEQFNRTVSNSVESPLIIDEEFMISNLFNTTTP